MGAVPESVKSDDSKEEFPTESASDEGLSVSADGSELQEPDRATENGGDQQKEEKSVKKGPVFGGATPEEASIEWPETAAAVNEGASVVSPPPAPSGTKTVKSYYMVKVPRAQSDLKMTDELGGKSDVVRSINSEIQAKRDAKQKIIAGLAEPKSRLREHIDALREKNVERKQVMDQLKELNEKAPSVNPLFYTSEKELDERIAQLEHEMQHNTMTLKHEKELVKEIKRLKASRSEVKANSLLDEQSHKYKSDKKALQEKLNPLQAEIDHLRKRKEEVEREIKPKETELDALTSEINDLIAKKSAADKALDGVRTQRNRLSDEERAKNMDFYLYKSESTKARELALSGNKDAVEQLCNSQVEKMMEMWNNDAEFRAEYVRRNIQSTVRRLQTLDGRALAAGEAPVKLNDEKTERPVVKSEVKANKEELVKAAKEPAKELPKTDKKEESRGKLVEKSEEPKEPELSPEEKAALEAVRMEEEREHRRQIEMEKQKEAAARKKRLLEKKQAKEKLKLEKEQQRKEQEREKKLRKKAAANLGVESTTEVEDIPPQEANGNHPQEFVEEKKAPANTGATRRGGPRQRPSNPSIKLQLKKKNTVQRLQRQLLDHWQIIVAALGVFIVFSLSAMIYVRS